MSREGSPAMATQGSVVVPTLRRLLPLLDLLAFLERKAPGQLVTAAGRIACCVLVTVLLLLYSATAAEQLNGGLLL